MTCDIVLYGKKAGNKGKYIHNQRGKVMNRKLNVHQWHFYLYGCESKVACPTINACIPLTNVHRTRVEKCPHAGDFENNANLVPQLLTYA